MARPCILIIDDDEDFRRSTRALLEGEGYEVAEAATGQQGLEAVRRRQPDLIILDIMMEDVVAGYAVNQALKFADEYREFKDVPVLMVSSIQEDPASRFPMAAETAMITPDSYMTKPLDVEKFLQRVKQMVGS